MITQGHDGFGTYDIIEELFESLVQRHQVGLETSMKVSNFVFGGIDGLHYKRNKISLNHDRSFIDFSQWLKNKKATINPKSNSHVMCFNYAVTTAINDKKLENIQKE